MKIGLLTLVIGMVLSLASAWCEMEAHLKKGHGVYEKGSPALLAGINHQKVPSNYLASSMAMRLFAVGAIFIVVGSLQLQRVHLTDRVERLEQELQAVRARPIAA